MRVMVTGHRPPKVGGYRTPNPTEQWVRSMIHNVLKGMLRKHPKLEGVSGMALGVDTIFAEECVALGIPFIAAVPFADQDNRWPDESRAHYRNLLSEAKKVVIVDQIPSYHSDQFGGKMGERNRWMVEHSKVTISVWDGSKGGTKNTVDLVRYKADRKMLRLNPSTFESTVEDLRDDEEDLVGEMFGVE